MAQYEAARPRAGLLLDLNPKISQNNSHWAVRRGFGPLLCILLGPGMLFPWSGDVRPASLQAAMTGRHGSGSTCEQQCKQEDPNHGRHWSSTAFVQRAESKLIQNCSRAKVPTCAYPSSLFSLLSHLQDILRASCNA